VMLSFMSILVLIAAWLVSHQRSILGRCATMHAAL
jgi:hypothetical protein